MTSFVVRCCSFTMLLLAGVATPMALAQSTQAKGESIYQLPMKITDQDNKTTGLDVFAGKQVVLAMFYSSCNHTCPLLIAALKDLDAKLRPEVRAQVRFLLVSLDPVHDTPSVLKAFSKRHALDLSRWKLARSSETSVRELAYVLDIKFRKNATGGYSHSSILSLLGADGQILEREEGLAQAAKKLRERLNRTVKGAHHGKAASRSVPAK